MFIIQIEIIIKFLKTAKTKRLVPFDQVGGVTRTIKLRFEFDRALVVRV